MASTRMGINCFVSFRGARHPGRFTQYSSAAHDTRRPARRRRRVQAMSYRETEFQFGIGRGTHIVYDRTAEGTGARELQLGKTPSPSPSGSLGPSEYRDPTTDSASPAPQGFLARTRG